MKAEQHSALNPCPPGSACGYCHNNIVDPRGFTLMTTPKVGTQSIVDMYRASGPRLMRWSSKEFVINHCKNHFVVGFIRNPFARLVSCWVDKCVNQNGHRTWPLYHMHGGMTFEAFAQRACDVPHDKADKHWRMQSFDMFDGERALPHVFVRLENINHDWAAVRAQIQRATRTVLGDIPHKHSTGRKPYQEYYTPELVELVGDYYHDDLVNFGYSYDEQVCLPMGAVAV